MEKLIVFQNVIVSSGATRKGPIKCSSGSKLSEKHIFFQYVDIRFSGNEKVNFIHKENNSAKFSTRKNFTDRKEVEHFIWYHNEPLWVSEKFVEGWGLLLSGFRSHCVYYPYGLAVCIYVEKMISVAVER